MGPSTRGKGAGREPEDAAQDQIDRETRRQEYFAGLPVALTDVEETLRAALLEVNAKLGNVRLSLVASDPAVKQAKAALDMPKGIGLGQWIQQRIPDDFSLATGTVNGEPMLLAAGSAPPEAVEATGAEAEAQIEEFYATLPADEFTDEELALREQILAALRSQGGSARLSALTRGGDFSKNLHDARTAVLPKGAPLVGWLERRLGTEVRVSKDDRGGNLAELIGEAAKGLRKGKGAGKDKGGKKGGGKGKDDTGKGREKVLQSQEELDAAKMQREARVEEFLATLPNDRLLPDEQRFREMLIGELQAAGRPVRLSLICQREEFKRAKARMMPQDIPTGAWIEHRIGAEVLLHKDDSNNSVASLAAAQPRGGAARRDPRGSYSSGMMQAAPAEPPVTKQEMNEERDARMAEYFASLGPLLPGERTLRNMLVDAARHRGGSSRLSDVFNHDQVMQQEWSSLKSKFMQMTPPLEATFNKWVELRCSDELKFTREPFIQVKGGGGMKRGGPSGYAPPAKAPRVNGGKGGGRAIGSK